MSIKKRCASVTGTKRLSPLTRIQDTIRLFDTDLWLRFLWYEVPPGGILSNWHRLPPQCVAMFPLTVRSFSPFIRLLVYFHRKGRNSFYAQFYTVVVLCEF